MIPSVTKLQWKEKCLFWLKKQFCLLNKIEVTMFWGGRFLLTSSLFKCPQWDGPFVTWDEPGRALAVSSYNRNYAWTQKFFQKVVTNSSFPDIPQIHYFTLKDLLFKDLSILRQILRFTEVPYLNTFKALMHMPSERYYSCPVYPINLVPTTPLIFSVHLIDKKTPQNPNQNTFIKILNFI